LKRVLTCVIEVLRQISVDDIGIAPAEEPVHVLDGINRAPARSITVRDCQGLTALSERSLGRIV